MRNQFAWGWIVGAAGALDAVVGVVLVGLRSRIPDAGG